MTHIEQEAIEIVDELQLGCVLNPHFEDDCIRDSLSIITRHLTTLTKPFEDENKRLREALEGVGSDLAKGWTGHAYRKVEQALTKPT